MRISCINLKYNPKSGRHNEIDSCQIKPFIAGWGSANADMVNVLYICGKIVFILSFFVLYILPFGLVRLRIFRLSAWVS